MNVNLDSLTVSQLKQIAGIVSCINGDEQVNTCSKNHPLAGKYVIVRARDAGVHAGFLESQQGREVVLTHSRRLWYWEAPKQHTLSAVALHGLTDNSKLSASIPTPMYVLDACEVFETTPEAEASIRSKAAHRDK